MNGQSQIATLLLAGWLGTTGPVADSEGLRAAGPHFERVSEELCRRLPTYKAPADVSVTPGRGARGETVAPADVAATAYALRPVYEFDVTLSPLDDENDGPGTRNADGSGTLAVARVTYYPASGAFFLDGKKIGGIEARALSRACADGQ